MATDEKLRIVPLAGQFDRAGSDSGVAALDTYFIKQAGQDVRRRLAACFMLTGNDSTPFGFYTLAATAIELAGVPAEIARRLPRYPTLPAALLGRLAVDRRHRGRRFGELLLMDAMRRALLADVASWALVVDAKDDEAARFYARYDFLPLTGANRRLFLPMAEIAGLFG